MSRSPSSARSLSGGSLAVMVGLGLLGLANLLLLSLAGRDLGPEAYAPLSVAWTAVNAVGIGLFIPAEQEISRRTAARRASGQQAPMLTHVLRYLGLMSLALLGLGLVAQDWLARTFFSGDRPMVLFTVAALVATGIEYAARGVLSGSGRFVLYGAQLMVDGLARALITVVIFVAGWGDTEAYAWALVVAPLVATVASLSPQVLRWLRDHPSPVENPVPLTPLIATTLTQQLVGNSGPLAIAALAGAADREATGNLVSAITIGRLPVMVYAAVQAVILPTLAGLVAQGSVTRLRQALRTALLLTVGIGLVGASGIAGLGPWALRLVYGPAFSVSWLHLVLIALSGAALMLALALGQSLQAFLLDRLVLLGWALGLLVTVATLWLPGPLTSRVVMALLAGATTSAVCHGIVLRRVVAQWSAQRVVTEGPVS